VTDVPYFLYLEGRTVNLSPSVGKFIPKFDQGDFMKKTMVSALGAIAVLSTVTMGCAADAPDAAGSASVEATAGSTANEGNFVSGTLQEWKVSVSPNTATAGEVKFTMSNNGTIGHEFLVVKTDILDGKIPLDGDHFAEPSPGLEVIDEIGEFKPGTTELLVLTLEPGNYQLVCNLPGHYAAGMHTTFVVS
jgi:uncharacterized cupredoxin-like copper-binding protein